MIQCFQASTIMVLALMSVSASMQCTMTQACLRGGASSLRVGAFETTCPDAEAIIFSWVERAVADDLRMAASLLRLHFHDCFVNGCDASVLLDDTDTFVGEKTAGPNLNSLRGFEVIDVIKADLELVCPETLSCADILATAARDSVVLVCMHACYLTMSLGTVYGERPVHLHAHLKSGGPRWEVEMGRKDSLSASKAAANNNIPGPNSDVATLVSKFNNVGLSKKDMVTLSGAHTIGRARCSSFSSRLKVGSTFNTPGLDKDFLSSLQQLCAESNSNTSTLANLDLVTPAAFDNQYYVNLVSGQGLLSSDQILVAQSGATRDLVESYANDPQVFYEEFKASMLRMGSLKPLTGEIGEIRRNCRTIN